MTFVDHEIAHITRAMTLSLYLRSDTGRPIFPAAYWRDRLRQLMDRYHLQHGQLCAVDTLLRQLDKIDAKRRRTVRKITAA
jgi:hypothetical protein